MTFINVTVTATLSVLPQVEIIYGEIWKNMD